jgi:hypothetical protein
MHIGNDLGIIFNWGRKMEVGGVWESLVHAFISGSMNISERGTMYFRAQIAMMGDPAYTSGSS